MRINILRIIFIFGAFQFFYAQSGLVGHWDFNDSNNPGKAVIGQDLIVQGNGLSSVEGPTLDNGAVTVGIGTNFIVPHTIKPSDDGKVSEYTIVMDVHLPEPDEWYSLFQTDISNKTESECYINENGNIGGNGIGYSDNKLDRIADWYRIVISVKNGNIYNLYSDGKKVLTSISDKSDNRFTLGNTFLLFADKEGRDNPIDVADVMLYSKALTENEIVSLGGYKHEELWTSSVNSEMVPYLQSPTPTSIYISWNSTSDRESIVKYGISESLGNSTSGTVKILDASNRWWHTVKLTDLTPETTYYYKVKTGATESIIYRFKTEPLRTKKTGHIRIAVVGDNRTNYEKYTEVIDSMKSTFVRLYGENIEENINLIINVGDIVTDGTVLSQYETEYFSPMQAVSPNIPTMVSIGNHENESENYYQHMNYEDFGGPQGEKYYSFEIGRIKIIALNTNPEYQNTTQINWLDGVLTEAQNSDDIDWIIVFCHHPGHSEYWPDGNTYYVQSRVIPTINKYSKADFLIYGHSHDYERGAVQEGNLRLLLSGGGGGGLDRYKRYANQRDYPEIQKVHDYYSYSIIDFDIENKRYEANMYALGHQNMFIPNEIRDTFYRDKNAAPPAKPNLLLPESGTNVNLPFILEAENFVDSYDIMSSQFQITTTSGNYSIPKVNEIRDFENLYGDSGFGYGDSKYIPKDLNEGIELNKFEVTDDMNLRIGRTYWWRARYRDKNLQWSEWSDEKTFIIVATAVNENTPQLPLSTELYNNYPNPFNPVTVIKFSLKNPGYTTLKIYSVTGELVKTLVSTMMPAGVFNVRWDGKDENNVPVSSGHYFYRLKTKDYTETHKALLLK